MASSGPEFVHTVPIPQPKGQAIALKMILPERAFLFEAIALAPLVRGFPSGGVSRRSRGVRHADHDGNRGHVFLRGPQYGRDSCIARELGCAGVAIQPVPSPLAVLRSRMPFRTSTPRWMRAARANKPAWINTLQTRKPSSNGKLSWDEYYAKCDDRLIPVGMCRVKLRSRPRERAGAAASNKIPDQAGVGSRTAGRSLAHPSPSIWSLNSTPSVSSVRQITRHDRRSPTGVRNLNKSGIV